MSNKLTFEEVKANRQIWLAFLRKKGRKKATQILDAGDGKRCCLGHACFALNIERRAYATFIVYGASDEPSLAPFEVRRKLGIRSSAGDLEKMVDITNDKRRKNGDLREVRSLAKLNDETSFTPKMIADFIEEQYDNVFLSEEEYKERYGVANV